MKKAFVFLICIFLLVGCGEKEKPTSSSNSADNSSSNQNTNSNPTEVDPDVGKYDVDFYLFHLSYCEHCQEEMAWIESIKNDYPYLKIHTYEIDTSKEREEIYNKVREQMGITSDYVPLTIIGEDFYVGFSESKGRKFLRNVNERSKKDYCDVVGTILEDGDVQACIEHNKGFFVK